MQFHFSIPVNDFPESRDFYENLGFKKINEWSRPEKEVEAVIMERDGCVIELVAHPSHRLSVNLGEIANLHLGLEVTDLQEILSQLTKDGVEIVRPMTEGITVKYFAFIKDPNGFSIELFESKS